MNWNNWKYSKPQHGEEVEIKFASNEGDEIRIIRYWEDDKAKIENLKPLCWRPVTDKEQLTTIKGNN